MTKQTIRVVAAVIERDGRYLLTQRKAEAVLPLLWEFPGGRVERGETDGNALVREVAERIGLTVIVGDLLAQNTHSYDSYDVHISLFSCWLPMNAEPQAVGVQQVRWVSSCDMGNYEFPQADKATMSQLLGLCL